MEGKTKSGFKFKVDERIFGDWRFTCAVSRTQSSSDLEKLAGAREMCELLLGEEGHADLMNHVAKANDGFVPADMFMAEVAEIMQASTKAKN